MEIKSQRVYAHDFDKEIKPNCLKALRSTFVTSFGDIWNYFININTFKLIHPT